MRNPLASLGIFAALLMTAHPTVIRPTTEGVETRPHQGAAGSSRRRRSASCNPGAWKAPLLACIGFPLAQAGGDKKDEDWVQLFNGKDIDGWKTFDPDRLKDWQVKGGILYSSGRKSSHLFSPRGDYENFHYRIEVKISDKGNSGQYFRTTFGKDYPKGYEAQINATFPDPQKTGSLYNFAKITEKLVEPDTWFTQEVIAKGNHIQIILNGKKVVDHTDDKPSSTKGSARDDDGLLIETMRKQISQMRRELTSLKRVLAEQAGEAAEDAESWFEAAAEGASRATQSLRAKAQTVSDVVQENPVTVSSSFLVGGIIGILIGLALGSSAATPRRWYEH